MINLAKMIIDLDKALRLHLTLNLTKTSGINQIIASIINRIIKISRSPVPPLRGEVRRGLHFLMHPGSIFFQHPIGLWCSEPYSLLADELGPVGKGIYWDVFELIRLGKGIDSLDHILSIYDGVRLKRDRESLQRKLRLVLSPRYNLFFVSQQRMVTIVDHTKDIREQNRRKLEGPSLFDGMEGW